MKNRVKIHHEGTGVLICSFLILAAFSTLAWYLSENIGAVVMGVSIALFCLMINFFRSPLRIFKGNQENVVVSSVDGTVVALEETYESEYLNSKVIQLSVFMTIFNVHANWFPVNGKVVYTAHHPGRFLSAWLPKASVENERSTIVIRTESGQEILVRQVAGAMARRIVTYAEEGDPACIEKHMGFIKFGSRVDIYLPIGTEIFVKIGDKTIGGITEVGKLRP
ncbi:MAG: phosphatidylserine decarboxylase family protein [Muribaculaceae bacterium]|nr:phosphatidylserine decarboxylase family protein [Muribaculaceae bacterium]